MNQQSPNLTISDIVQVVNAIRVAQSRGSFHLEESAQLAPIVQRLEEWSNYIKALQSKKENSNGETENE